MRILFVTELWPPHSSAFVFEQVRAIAQFVSATVIVLVPHPPNLPRYRSIRSPFIENPEGPCRIPELGKDVPVYYLRYRTILELGKYLNSVQALRVLMRFLRHQKERFDLIHAHFAYTVGFAAARAGQRFGIPVIVTVHGSDINYYTHLAARNLTAALFTRWGLRHATAVTVVCEDLKQKAMALGVPAARLTIVPAGIRESLFFPRGERRALRRQLQLPEDGVIFLFVGNFVPVKGLDFLLAALARICLQLPQATLLMIGSGALEAELKHRAKKLGIDQRIIWAGRKPHAEIPFWLSAANCLVLPSLSEGYPMVLLESLACGTPIIASRVGGVPEILIAPDFGVMVTPGDSEALARAMLDAVGKKWNTTKLVAYAHANTWAERAQRFLKLYQNVLAQQAKSKG